jgi:hypothetical protein
MVRRIANNEPEHDGNPRRAGRESASLRQESPFIAVEAQ